MEEGDLGLASALVKVWNPLENGQCPVSSLSLSVSLYVSLSLSHTHTQTHTHTHTHTHMGTYAILRHTSGQRTTCKSWFSFQGVGSGD